MEKEAARLALPVFQQEEWIYFDSPVVPTLERLEMMLRGLVYNVKNGAPESRSGRFVVRRDSFSDDRIEILLALTNEEGE